MSPSGRKFLAAALLGVFVVGWAASLVFAARNRSLALESLSLFTAFAAFMVVGALIVAFRPGNAVGRIFCAIGLLTATGGLAQEYAQYAYVTRPGSLPVPLLAAWYASSWWLPTVGLTLIFTLFLFPTGRLPTHRWKPIAWVAGLDVVALTVLAALNPTLDVGISNPIGVQRLGNVEESTVGGVLLGLATLSIVAALLSLVIRFWRSRGDERQQLKWFTFAGALMVLTFSADELLPGFELGNFAFGVIVALLPISAGIAILRYRLYDIDLVINRTLVYGSLTALLALVYVAGVVGLPRLLPLAEDNDLLVAGSTLAVAALFSPLRQRTQAFVDRRFYRRRYDARRTVEAFSVRLRNEMDLDELRIDLLGVVQETFQPAHLSVWLKETGRAGG